MWKFKHGNIKLILKARIVVTPGEVREVPKEQRDSGSTGNILVLTRVMVTWVCNKSLSYAFTICVFFCVTH